MWGVYILKIIVSGGGTGGHIYPAITLIKGIKKQDKEAQIIYIGTSKGLEADIVKRAGIKFVAIDVEGLLRKISLKNFFRLVKVCLATIKMLKFLKAFKPDIVVGTGGYVSFPVLFAATILGVPTIVHEQNIIAGLCNKILSHFVTKVALGMKGAKKDFPKGKTVYTGNPIREELISLKQQDARRFLNIETEKILILVTGGSSGARSINQAMLEVEKYFAGDARIEILHITGKNEYEDVLARLKERDLDIKKVNNIHIYPYLYDMPQALVAADLIISRAGAISIAEITAKAKASILIPYPYATLNHQEKNARLLEKVGACKMILDKDLTGKNLKNILVDVLEKENALLDMAQKAKSIGNIEATANFTKLVFSLC